MRRLLLPLLLVPLPALAQDDDDGEGFLTELIEDNLSGVSRTVDITGFEGALSSSASIERLTIADAEGVWLEAEGLVLDWNRGALLRGRLEVESLRAERIALPRAPVPDPDAGPDLPAPEAQPFALPELPVSVQIGSLAADRIEIGQELIGEDLVATLDASASLVDGEGAAQIVAERIDGTEGRFEIDVAYSNATGILTLDTTFEEEEGGLVTRTLGLPGAPAVRFDLDGTGPPDGFDGELALATGGVDRIAGTFGSDRSGEDTTYSIDIDGDVSSLIAPEFQPFFGPDVSLDLLVRQAPDGSLAVETLDLSARAVRLTGSAALGPDGWPSRLALDGAVGTGDGATVLPGGGGETRIDRADLSVSYDASVSDDWEGSFVVDGLATPDLTLPRLRLTGGGTIVPGDGDALGRLTAVLDYAAEGLSLADPALDAAIPADISGVLELIRQEGAPLELPRITLSGGDLSLEAMANVDGGTVEADAMVSAGDFARFSALAGRELSGAGTVLADGTFRPLDGIFDVLVTAETTDLAIGEPRLDPLLAGSGRVALDATRDTEGLRIAGLTVRTDLVSIDGSAEVTSGASSGRIDAEIAELSEVVPGLSGPATLNASGTRGTDGAASGELRATVPAGEIAADVQLALGGEISAQIEAALDRIGPYAALAGLEMAGAVDIDAEASHAPDTGATVLRLNGTTRDLRTPLPALDPVLAGEGRIDLAASGRIDEAPGLDDLGSLDLTLNVPAADLTLTAAGGEEIAGSVRAAVRDLSAFAALAGRDLSGRGTVDATGAYAPATGAARITLEATTDDVETGLAQVDPILAGAGRLTLTARGMVDDTPAPEDLSVLDLRLSYPAATLDLSASQEDGTISGEVDARIAGLAAFSGSAGREIAGSVDLSGTGSYGLEDGAATLDLTGASRGLRTGFAQVDPIVAGDGTFRIAGAGRIDASPSPDDLSALDVALDYPAVTLDLDAAQEAGEIAGEIDLAAPRLSVFSGLAGRTLAGSVDVSGTGSYGLESGTVALDLSGTTRDLRTGLADIDPLLAGAGTLDLSAAGVVDGSPGPEDLDRLDLSLSLPAVTLDADIATEGERLQGAVTATVPRLSAFAGLAGRNLSGRAAAELRGFYVPATGAFEAGVDLTTTDLGTGIAAVDQLTAGSGSLTGQAAGDGTGGYSLTDARLSYPNLTASADARTDGTTGSADFDVRLRDVGLFTDALSGPLSVSGSASQQAGGWQVNTTLDGPGGATARVSGLAGAQLGLDITGQVPLALLNRVLDPQRLSGTARFDLRADGPPALSALSGTVSLADARFTAPNLGQTLEDIGGQVTLRGGAAQVNVTASVPAGGGVTVTGPVQLSAPFDANLSVGLNRVRLRDPNLYETRVNGAITVDGALAGGASIAGQINLGETELRVPSSSVGALGDLPPVTHVGASAAVRQTLDRAGLSATPERQGRSGGRPFPLDITVSAPSRIFVRGRGLDAELGGSLRLSGTTANIVPSGQFSLIRGRLDILQQRFALSEGVARLQGDFSPFLRLVAATETEDGTEVQIVIEGNVGSPEVRFTSSPELPQDEVLARLLFGRTTADISPLQAVQLAGAIGTLAGRGGDGVIGRFRRGLDLDDLDLLTDEEGNAAVRAGKYISENVYTEVTVGSTGETEIDLNIDLTDQITARGSVTEDGETSLGVFFERDY